VGSYERLCGHYGDGPDSQHVPSGPVEGHGACLCGAVGVGLRRCKCDRFKFDRWTLPFVAYLCLARRVVGAELSPEMRRVLGDAP